MPGKTHCRFLAIAIWAALAVILAVALPGVSADGDEGQAPPIPDKAELEYPNLGSHLDQLVTSVEGGGTTAEDAAAGASMHREESVAVTIYLSGSVDDVVQFLEDFGGDPRNVGEDYIEAYVPVSLLGPVSEQPGVLRVREIVPPEPAYGDFTSQGVEAHGSSAWNDAGHSGQGVKVGVIDVGFKDLTSLMGTELPARVQGRCYTDIGVFTQDLADCEDEEEGDNHGTAVAEAVMDIAPEVSLYIANPMSLGDLQAAADWMVSEGVSVINHSVDWLFDGPGDGTSPVSNSPLNTVDRAVEGGIIWINAAGNSAQQTWFASGRYLVLDSDRFVEFDQTKILNCFPVEPETTFETQLRWDDAWGGAIRDLDLYWWDTQRGEIVRRSQDLQSGEIGHIPFEIIIATYTGVTETEVCLVVRQFSGSTPDWLQVKVGGVGSIAYYTENGSIGNPAESANPAMLAVGAAHYWDTHTIAEYSSRGPTPDDRVKPDIVGTACGETASYEHYLRDGNSCWFAGTSQASPHVAGMAALVRQRFPGYTPAQVADYLKDHARQRETPDPNNTWGHGFAQLPSPDREALVALYNATGGANWTDNTNWVTNTPVGQWYGVITDASSRVTEINLTRNQLKGEIPPELANLTNLKVLALGGNELTGTIPTWLGSLANLVELHLADNQLTGEIPSELGRLSNLTVLSLSRNELTGEISAELVGLTNLKVLALGGNELTGTIPTWLGSLANLEELYLWGNELTGEIPAELGSLANLVELHLADNQLTGEVPVELGNLANLEVLALGGNELTGTIPTWLGSLANLEELYLWGNELTGEIPAELGSLANLVELHLADNQLTGEIPVELGSLANLVNWSCGGTS